MPKLSRFLAISIVAIAMGAGLIAVAGPASAATLTPARLLQELDVRPESTSPAYNRDAFRHWVDTDGDGCDTRAEVLIAESATPVRFSSGCTVSGGRWTSYYDGVTWTRASDVDVDHFVPLQEAWQSGASRWTAAKRQAYANDLRFAAGLVGVTDNLNSAKGGKDYAEWKPPAANAQCRYAHEWIQVKYRWDLSINNAEFSALNAKVKACGSTPIKVPPRGSATGQALAAMPSELVSGAEFRRSRIG